MTSYLAMHLMRSPLMYFGVWSRTEPAKLDRRLVIFVFRSVSRVNAANMVNKLYQGTTSPSFLLNLIQII